MKKQTTFLIAILGIVFSLSISQPIYAGAFEQDSTIEQVESLQLSEIPGEIYSDVKSALGAIAKGLGTTAEYVWPILVRQQIVYAVGYLSMALLFAALTMLLYKAGVRHEQEGWYVAAVFAGIITAGVLIGTGELIFTGFINPEYGAIREVLSIIK